MDLKVTDSLINHIVMLVYRVVLALLFTIVASYLYSVPVEHIIIGITVTYLTEIFILIDERYH